MLQGRESLGRWRRRELAGGGRGDCDSSLGGSEGSPRCLRCRPPGVGGAIREAEMKRI